MKTQVKAADAFDTVYKEMMLSTDWRKKITLSVFTDAYNTDQSIERLVDTISDIEYEMEGLDEDSDRFDRLDVKLLKLYTSLSSKLKTYYKTNKGKKKASASVDKKQLASSIQKVIAGGFAAKQKPDDDSSDQDVVMDTVMDVLNIHQFKPLGHPTGDFIRVGKIEGSVKPKTLITLVAALKSAKCKAVLKKAPSLDEPYYVSIENPEGISWGLTILCNTGVAVLVVN